MKQEIQGQTTSIEDGKGKDATASKYHQTNERYAPEREIGEISGLSSNTIRALEKDGKFPKRKRVGFRAVRWWLPDVLEWAKNPQGWTASAA